MTDEDFDTLRKNLYLAIKHVNELSDVYFKEASNRKLGAGVPTGKLVHHLQANDCVLTFPELNIGKTYTITSLGEDTNAWSKIARPDEDAA